MADVDNANTTLAQAADDLEKAIGVRLLRLLVGSS